MRRVLTFYKFVPVAEPQALQQELLELGQRLDLKGTVLVAPEGINGTLVGRQPQLQTWQNALIQRVGPLPFKWSELNDDNLGFYRFKVKLKSEIVTLGLPELEVVNTGEHVAAERWHDLLDDPEVVVIDTRNTYEIDIGTFPGAINPGTTNFRDFPAWVAAHLDPQQHRQVAMFCTGGIRCEKASAYMLEAGFESVYQLDGGVLRYLETVASEENRWQGECFVFDQRVSVTSELTQGTFSQCYACRHPISVEDKQSPLYEPGVSCPHCGTAASAEPDAARLQGLRERQRQVSLAEQRGELHVGQAQAVKSITHSPSHSPSPADSSTTSRGSR